MKTVVDFHSHILPGIDDGSKTVEESLAMLEQMRAQKIDRVVATPHFYPHHDQLARFLDRRRRAEEILREKLREKPDFPQLHIGAEVYFFPGISDCEELPLLTIDGGRYIMIEMPHMHWTEEMFDQLEQIYTKHNLYPIIAHIDRYLMGRRSDGKLFERLTRLPLLIQANAEFFLERRSRKLAMRMLQEGKIHLLGSDCHNLTDRSPNLAQALENIRKNLGDGPLAYINDYEEGILNCL